MLGPGALFARRYRLVRVLGSGAMGVVYEAVHEALGHRVAIKMLRPGSTADDRAVRRFEREARLAAKLTSPHVVKVFDVDRADDETPYLVMELLEGRDLAREIDAREASGPLPIEECVSWALAICDAMCDAHDAGIVHRDLKPSNVFLTTDGVVKVLDFGVASFHGNDAEASITASVAGTPRYMAPEQLLGESPSPTSDVWAVGVMLYRFLTGRFPYDAPTMAAQMLAIMAGEERIESVAPRVPKALAVVVHRALGKTFEERFSDMHALRAALRPFTTTSGAEETIMATPPTGANVARPTAPPTRLRVTMLVVGVLAAVVAGAGGVEIAHSSRDRDHDRAERRPPTSATIAVSAAPAAPAESMAMPATTPQAKGSVSPAPSMVPLPPSAGRRSAPASTASSARPEASVDDGFPSHL